MAISARQVKHKRTEEGVATDRPGTVYDVFISYKAPDGKRKTYAKRGFPTKKSAIQHEAEMRNKLLNPSYVPITQTQAKTLLKDYLSFWLETYGKANLRPSTFSSYKGMITTHINPSIGHIPLRSLTSENIDAMLKEMSDKRLATSTCRYAQHILSVALEGAIKYHYIERNPARDIMTKFGKSAKTPPPYTIEQVQKLLSLCANGEWEMPVVLSGLYGLRRGEVLGLRWQNIDLKNKTIAIVEQLPFGLAPGTKVVEEMAPTKSHDRTIPITDVTLSYFIRQKQLQVRQKELTTLAGQPYYDNDLVVAKADGSPLRPDHLSTQFPQFLRHNDMPHIRFHDLRHTAATNMHELTGDFYTVGEILGHTLKGVSTALGISTNMPDVTARYVEVRAPRKSIVLEAYHNTVFPREAERLATKKSKDRDAVR